MSGDAEKLTATLRAPLSQEIVKKQKEVQERWKKLEEKTRERGKRLNESFRCVCLKCALLTIPKVPVFCAENGQLAYNSCSRNGYPTQIPGIQEGGARCDRVAEPDEGKNREGGNTEEAR